MGKKAIKTITNTRTAEEVAEEKEYLTMGQKCWTAWRLLTEKEMERFTQYWDG